MSIDLNKIPVSGQIRPQKPVLALAAAVIWFMVSSVATYWVLHWPSFDEVSESLAQEPSSDPIEPSVGIARALGTINDDTARNQVLELVGVIATDAGSGAALIAINGQLPQPFLVGQTVVDGLVLQSLTAREAQLGPSLSGEVRLQIQLPE